MSVIVEFTIDREGFALGQALTGRERGEIKLERIVPAGDDIVPFFWMKDGAHRDLEGDVDESEYVENLAVMDQVADRTLYRVEWAGERDTLLDGIAENDGTILEAHSAGEWFFRLRFFDHQHLAKFYNYCLDRDLHTRVERVYTLTEESLQGRIFDLTPAQREALVLAVEEGYFATPRETSMDELASELDITQQSFADRLWRGTEKVLRNVLLD